MVIQSKVYYGTSYDHNNLYSALEVAKYYKDTTGRSVQPPFSYVLFKSDIFTNGVVIFNNYYKGGNIDIHLEIKPKSGIYNRQNIRNVLSYPFNQLNCTRITGNLSSNNETLIKIAERLGFKLEARLKNYFGVGIDNMVYSANREDLTKWIE